MFSAMEKDPDFRRDGSARMGLREERAKTFRRCVKALALIGETMDPFERKSKLVALQMYDPSLEVKVALLKDMREGAGGSTLPHPPRVRVHT